MELVRNETQERLIPVQFLLKVVQGKVKRTRVSDRIEAANQLADRGFGKPLESLEFTGEVEVR